MNATEPEEREHLEVIKEQLTLAIRRGDAAVRQASHELREKKKYLHEHRSGLDDSDRVAAGQSIDRMAFTGEAAVARKRRLLQLLQSPYFGRVDFTHQSLETWPVYIGLSSFTGERQRQGLIYDWRAPSPPCLTFFCQPPKWLIPAAPQSPVHIHRGIQLLHSGFNEVKF